MPPLVNTPVSPLHYPVALKRITIYYDRVPDEYDFAPSTTMCELKEAFLKRNHHRTTASPDQLFLYYHQRAIDEDLTLEEVGVGKDQGIVIVEQPDCGLPKSRKQQATGGQYSSSSDFNTWTETMKRAMGIVCLVRKHKPFLGPFGTGFLIGSDMLMTCAHNFPLRESGISTEDIQNYKATFFYGEGRREFVVDLVEVVGEYQSRQAPEPHNRATAQMLDYVIIRFKIPWWTHASIPKMWRLKRAISCGQQMFKRAREEAEEALSEQLTIEPKGEPLLEFANIIQHPANREKGEPSLKQIAHHNTSIIEATLHTLHYKSQTFDGSSGSPAIDDSGRWRGVHDSTCSLLDLKLLKQPERVFKRLNLSEYVKTESNEYIFKDGTKYSDKLANPKKDSTKGLWFEPGQKGKGMVKFIREKAALSYSKFEVWVQKLLPEERFNEGHTLCNTAISARSILEDMRQKDDFSAYDKTERQASSRLNRNIALAVALPLLALGASAAALYRYGPAWRSEVSTPD